MAMFRSRGALSLTFLSPRKSSPEVMSSSPTIMRRIVDFPEPDGPTRTTNSPSAMSRLTSSTTGVVEPENVLVRWSSRMVVMGHLSLLSSLHRPKVRPEMIWRWDTSTRIITGMVTITAAVEMAAVGCWNKGLAGEERQRRPRRTGPIRALSEMPNTKSFQPKQARATVGNMAMATAVVTPSPRQAVGEDHAVVADAD